ncbi:zinc finger protein 703 isoform X2 [Grammomys surdaster]|uniref:zinc finger protein 703 isoform X2 n=1 Tax=Grammomys surdaster TaxID=491861 RepID=UPI0010A0AA2B|nr:zinc finger protein 703 isoform X2 [Grammomys surdaster]
MSDSPAGSNPRTPESSGSGGSGGGGKRPAVPAVVSLLPPADPLRQANRLPIRVLKMLSAHTGHLLHPEYLQPLSSTPVSPIEVIFPWSKMMGRLSGKGRITTPITEKSPLTGRVVVEPFLLRASAHDTLRG